MALLTIGTVFVLLLALRVPVAFTLGAATITGIIISPTPISVSMIASIMWQAVNSFVLLAIPAFILMGNLALASGVTKRLVEVSEAFVGHIHGGLAHVGVIVNVILAGMSGSDMADAAASGSILIPAMKKAGFPVGYAASIIAGAATIGPLIPPSIAFVIFAAATDVSVGRLFLGGALPGVVLAIFLMVQAYFTARRNNYPRSPRVSYRRRATTTLASIPALVIPTFVIGSILTGTATPTEAAVVGVLAVLLVGGVIYRGLNAAIFTSEALATLRTAGQIFLIIAVAAAFARVLTLYGVADALAQWVISVTDNQYVFLIGINIVFLLLGCIIDTVPIILVFVPLLMPTVMALGIDPVQFGVVTVFNLLIGLITPPYGLTMFLVCSMSGITVIEFWRHCWPIFMVMILALILTTFYPPLTLWLPNLLLPVSAVQ